MAKESVIVHMSRKNISKCKKNDLGLLEKVQKQVKPR